MKKLIFIILLSISLFACNKELIERKRTWADIMKEAGTDTAAWYNGKVIKLDSAKNTFH